MHLLQSFKLKSQDILVLGVARQPHSGTAGGTRSGTATWEDSLAVLARLDVCLPHEPATHSEVAPKIKDVHSKACKVSLAVEPQKEVTSRSIHTRMSNSKG